MSKPAARIGDMHVCPMVTPGTPPVPHVGGPVIGPGVPTVLICGQPAAVLGDMCTCVGPPDTIVLGSVGVLIGGKPAARMGDMCAHGGTIVAGAPTVLIGEVSPGAPAPPVVLAQMKAMELAAETGADKVPVEPGSLSAMAAFFRELLGIKARDPRAPETIVAEVNPNKGKINCGHIIDSVIARITGVDPEAVTTETGRDGSFPDIAKRHNTTFSSKADFAEVFAEVENGGPGTTQIVGMAHGKTSHVVVITNHHGKAMILEGQAGGHVLDSPEAAVKFYGHTYGQSPSIISAPVN